MSVFVRRVSPDKTYRRSRTAAFGMLAVTLLYWVATTDATGNPVGKIVITHKTSRSLCPRRIEK